MNRSHAARILLFALCAKFAAVAHALSTDSDQPIEIESDFAELDDQEHKTIYIGNVIVTQGSIRMTGDKLRANFNENRELIEAFMEGRPAHFKQTPDGDKQDIMGEALDVEYYAKKNLLFLIQRAKLTQGERLFEGYRINYDTKKSIITGRGTPGDKPQTPEAGAPKSQGRVHVIIPPKTPPGGAAPAPVPAPATP
ncbi:MAG: lipopolysaccharide transport periplasmic protein LptA [Gammaproteobacteria bacterium]|nr:lipopolysaccharide transport periplasmic protein LptA [Gammaproteobacteria bacterium]